MLVKKRREKERENGEKEDKDAEGGKESEVGRE